MKIIDRIRETLVGNIYSNEEIDGVMEEIKYFPVESEENDDENNGTDKDFEILKYTNKKSQIWVKCSFDGESYLVNEVTMRTKKSGKTEVQPFRNPEDIRNMLNYFREHKMYDEFLTFVFGMLLARRIGDVLTLKWSDFYEENGQKKEILNTLIEQKTDKTIDISITKVLWKYIDWYCEITNTTPMEKFNKDIFWCKQKADLGKKYSKKEYAYAIRKQADSFRHQFKKAADVFGIKDVSTHSLRKTFGYIAHQMNQYDPDNLFVLQTTLGHESIETTKRYIGVIRDKAVDMFNDVSQYLADIDDGKDPVIDKIIVTTLKTADLRNILIQAYELGKVNSDETNVAIHMNNMNDLMSMVEKVRIS